MQVGDEVDVFVCYRKYMNEVRQRLTSAEEAGDRSGARLT